MSSLRVPFALFGVALATALVIGANGPLYWDTFGYLTQAIRGDVGGLMLGRPVFVYVSYAIAHTFLRAGGSIWDVEPLLRICWLLVSCASAPLTYALALSAGLTRRGAAFAGLAVAASPALAHTSNAVLTDGPALTLTLLSLVLACRGVEQAAVSDRPVRSLRDRAGWTSGSALIAVSAALLGLACGVRETAVLNVPILALILWRAPRAARARFASVAVGALAIGGVLPVLWVWMHQPGYVEMIRAWQASMVQHRLEKTYGWLDAGYAVIWTLALGPATTVAACVAWCRAWRILLRPGTVLFALVVPSIAQLIFFGGYFDISYSPRYLLAALPGALAIPAAMTLASWSAGRSARLAVAVAALVIPVCVAAPFVHAREDAVRAGIRGLQSMTADLPAGSVIVTGQLCPGIAWLQTQIAYEQGARPDWNTVCPGWAWPADLPATLDRARADGRTLVLDMRPASWVGAEQHAALAELRRYVDSRKPAALIWK